MEQKLASSIFYSHVRVSFFLQVKELILLTSLSGDDAVDTSQRRLGQDTPLLAAVTSSVNSNHLGQSSPKVGEIHSLR